MLRSRQAEGESPVSAANARERYSSVENPESEATSFTGREVVSRSLFASFRRVFAIIFYTEDELLLRKTCSTSVRENPMCLNTSDADMPLTALRCIKDTASANQRGAFG